MKSCLVFSLADKSSRALINLSLPCCCNILSSHKSSFRKSLEGSSSRNDFNEFSSDDRLSGSVEGHCQLLNHLTGVLACVRCPQPYLVSLFIKKYISDKYLVTQSKSKTTITKSVQGKFNCINVKYDGICEMNDK